MEIDLEKGYIYFQKLETAIKVSLNAMTAFELEVALRYYENGIKE